MHFRFSHKGPDFAGQVFEWYGCVCVFVCVLYLCGISTLWVHTAHKLWYVSMCVWAFFFFSLYWLPVGWTEILTPFPAVVDRETFGPEALETRHCLEELPVTAAYNHSICHCFSSFLFFRSSSVWCSLFGPRGQDLSVRESPRHEKDFTVIAVVISSAVCHRAHY